MATTEPTPARPPRLAVFTSYVLSLTIIVAMIGVIWLIAPVIYARYASSAPLAQPQPTARIAPAPAQRAPVAPAPAVDTVQQSIDAYNATATAQYNAALRPQQSAPIPNTDITGDSAPVVLESHPFDRQPAGANVPTAEPIAPVESNDQTGSKPVLVNPQETHECRHAQVWTDNGCKNPTPIGAP